VREERQGTPQSEIFRFIPDAERHSNQPRTRHRHNLRVGVYDLRSNPTAALCQRCTCARKINRSRHFSKRRAWVHTQRVRIRHLAMRLPVSSTAFFACRCMASALRESPCCFFSSGSCLCEGNDSAATDKSHQQSQALRPFVLVFLFFFSFFCFSFSFSFFFFPLRMRVISSAVHDEYARFLEYRKWPEEGK
jgi:hypothetical protein